MEAVQRILRHGKIQATLDLYSQADRDEMQEAQRAHLEEIEIAPGMVQ